MEDMLAMTNNPQPTLPAPGQAASVPQTFEEVLHEYLYRGKLYADPLLMNVASTFWTSGVASLRAELARVQAKLRDAREEIDDAFAATLETNRKVIEIEAAENAALRSKLEAVRGLGEQTKEKAVASREESGRIRRTVYVATDAESNCLVRAELWDELHDELLAILGTDKPAAGEK